MASFSFVARGDHVDARRLTHGQLSVDLVAAAPVMTHAVSGIGSLLEVGVSWLTSLVNTCARAQSMGIPDVDTMDLAHSKRSRCL